MAPNRRSLLPAKSPMRSISSQPEKASLTLWISAHVDSLLLLVIWRTFFKEKPQPGETLSCSGANALKSTQ